MKKVLLYGVSETKGGIEKLLLNVIKNVDSSALKFDILTYYDRVAYHDEFTALGVNIYTITSKHADPIKNHKDFDNFFKQHAEEYDAVWCNLAELINIDVLKFAKKYKIKKRVIHSHSVTSTRGKLITTLHKINKKKIGSLATDFWAASTLAGKWFYSDKILNSDKFLVIKNAIDEQQFAFNQQKRDELRKQFGVEGKFVIGDVARLDNGFKNINFLLEIFSEILKINPDSKLLLVGDGPDRAEIENKADQLGVSGDVVMLGVRDDVNDIVNAMDAFVFPSTAEGFGLVLIEAQANGLPCFASADVIPGEVAVTNLLKFIKLDSGAKAWAKEITDADYTQRRSYAREVYDAGYSMVREAKRIEKLFLGEKE